MTGNRITHIYAIDNSTGNEVAITFTNPQVMVMAEDGSLQARVVYVERGVTLLLTFEIDPKSVLPMPQAGEPEPEMFGAWRTNTGPPAGTGMTGMPGRR